MGKGSPSWRLMMVSIGCLQNFLMGGVIFGWAAISNTLLVSDEGAPDLRAAHIHQMFVMASSANMCSPMFLGVVLDYYGPRACSVVSIFISCCGFLLFGCAGNLASTRDAAEPLFTLAVILIGFGGPGVQNAIIHLSNLFPGRKSTVTGIITGCFQLSFCIFFVFDQLWFFGNIDYRAIFLIYGVICALCMLASITLWPDKPFQFEEEVMRASPQTRSRAVNNDGTPAFTKTLLRFPSTFRKGGIGTDGQPMMPVAAGGEAWPPAGNAAWPPAGNSSSSSSSSRRGNNNNATGTHLLPPPASQRQQQQQQQQQLDLKDMPLATQLRSKPFFTATMLLTVASFWANFYIGAVDLQLQDEAFMDTHAQGDYMRAFTIVTVMGVLGIPFVGYAMDTWGFRVTLALTVGLGCVWAAATLVPSAFVLGASFGVYALFRTFTFNFFFAFLADSLGFRFFGILAGASFFVAGVVGLLADPLVVFAHGTCPNFPQDAVGKSAEAVEAAVEACHHGNWQLVNLAKLASLACLFVFPLTGSVGRPKIKEPQLQVSQYGTTGTGGGMPPKARSAGQGPRYELVNMVPIQQGP